jgi:hypothetical protein
VPHGPSRPWDYDILSICPICRAHHDGMANAMDERGPQNGDVNVCIVCKGISVYDTSVPTKLRFPTDEELEVFNADPRLNAIRAAMEVVEEHLGPPPGDYWPDR